MDFLEDAREHNVLRTIGPVYQFRHARLQDLLATPSIPGTRAPHDDSRAGLLLDSYRSPSSRYRVDVACRTFEVVLAATRRGGTEAIAWWRIPSWVGPVPRALVIGLAALAAYWLGQALVEPELSGTWLGNALGLAVGLGAALGAAVGARRELDDPDARWAFLLRHPTLVLGAGAAIGFSLGNAIARLFTVGLLIQVTIGLPIGVGLWLLFGLVARRIDRNRRPQIFSAWRSVHDNRPLLLAIGAGLGWWIARSVATAGTSRYWVVATIVGAAVFGLIVRLGLARPQRGSPTVSGSPYDSWKHGRVITLVLWFTVGGLVTSLVAETTMRAWLYSGLAVRNPALALVLSLVGASGYVLGLMFPRTWSASLSWLQIAVRHRRRLPIRLMRFLEDARDRGILHVDGAVYRFDDSALAALAALTGSTTDDTTGMPRSRP
jgi:hypothetical protein